MCLLLTQRSVEIIVEIIDRPTGDLSFKKKWSGVGLLGSRRLPVCFSAIKVSPGAHYNG